MLEKRTSRYYESRKHNRRIRAESQMNSLFSLALSAALEKPDIASRYAEIVWNLSTRYNVKLKEKRMFYCHDCKRFIVPPDTARIRLSKKRKALNITCLACQKTHRRII